MELTGIVVYRSEEAFDHAECVLVSQLTYSEEVLLNLCKKEVYVPGETWEAFIRAYIDRMNNKDII